MKLNNLLIFLALFFFLSLNYFAQTKTLVLPNPTPNPTPPPGNMKLLAGYTHERKQGIDSSVGVISKKDGLHIGYDIGAMAGNRALGYLGRNKEKLSWFKFQKLNGDNLLIVYFKTGRIVATFQKKSANFFADIKKEEEIIDFLLMVTTYDSICETYQKKTRKKTKD